MINADQNTSIGDVTLHKLYKVQISSSFFLNHTNQPTD